jgi:hypothetical protein
MESRTEPRFETRSSAVVEIIRDRAYTYDATITEVSGIGLRIEMAEELKVGENIRLTVNGYQMFATVRRCLPAESGFTIGVERVDSWDGPKADSAPVSAKATKTVEAVPPTPANVLGRPKLKNPLDNLHGAALRGLFADPRWRTPPKSYKTAFIAAGCIALTGWAGIGGWSLLRHKAQVAPSIKTDTAKPLPGDLTAGDATPPKTNTTKTVSSAKVTPVPVQKAPVQAAAAQKPPTQAPVAQKAPVQAPAAQKTPVQPLPAQKAPVQAPPVQIAKVQTPSVQAPPTQKAPAQTPPAATQQSKISIKASDISWMTACADGAKALDMLLTKGYTGEIHFSNSAKVRFGNAGAVELAVGNQPFTKLGASGEVKTIKVTPAGYEQITLSSALNCSVP